MTRDEMELAIRTARKSVFREGITPDERRIFLAGMRAAAEIYGSSKQMLPHPVTIHIIAVADELEKKCR